MLREYGLDNKYVTTDDDTVYQLLSKRALERPDELIAQFKDPQTNQWVDVMAGEMLAQAAQRCERPDGHRGASRHHGGNLFRHQLRVGCHGFRMCQHWCGERSDL